MSKVGIVTDSIRCLPSDLIKEYGILMASGYLLIDGKDYREQIDITAFEFWRVFKDLRKLPKNDTAGPGNWINAVTDMARNKDKTNYLKGKYCT